MKQQKYSRVFLTAVLFLAVLASAPLPRSSADSTYQALPFSQAWSDTGLITTNDDWSGVSGIVGYRGDGLTSSNDIDPQTVLADGTTTPVDVNANQTNPNTFTTGGVAEFEISDPVVALQGSGTADAPFLLIHVDTSGLRNITVSYNLRDIDGSTDNAVQQVALHYRVGTSGDFTNVPAGYVADATTGPSLATLVTAVNVILPAAANDQSQLQIRIMTTNATGNDEWVGVDDLSITGTPIGGAGIPSSSWMAITLDGTNDFPVASLLTENPFAAPTAGGSSIQSDAFAETSAYHWIDSSWNDHTLSGGNTADLRNVYITWDSSYLYLGVQGPNAMMDNDDADLFLAIDTDGSPTSNLPQASVAWGKWVDFYGWTPEYFIAVSQARDLADGNPAGYAELVPAGGSGTALAYGTDWANSAWANDTSGGVFFEFRLSWSALGLSGAPDPDTGTPMNLAAYTTYNDTHSDVYDNAPGVGQGTTYEQLGDYKGDADYCSGNLDPVTGSSDGTCGWGDSDDNLGSGVSQAGRSPGSDDGANESPDTIGEYFRVLNVGQTNPTAIDLLSFTATPHKAAIVLRWETATEIDNLGFHLYRAKAPEGERTRLNASLIPSQNPGSPVGAVYTWRDRSAQPGVTYYYWLEDVDLHGQGTLHGPVSATMKPRLLPAHPQP
jgi:hypothetical protein